MLHCHLPFVRHPKHEEFLEENWLFEAVTETYLPLIESFERLASKDVDFRITVSLSPTLCEMLSDELLGKRCGRYIERKLELCEKEKERLAGTEFTRALQLYETRFSRQNKKYGTEACEAVIKGFRRLKDKGHVELITTAATHALLSLCHSQRAAGAQIEQGCRCHEKHFGERPSGLWLPECAYSPQLDPLLRGAGIRYSFLESHGALLGDPPPENGVFTPIATPGGLVMFARDPQSSNQVWSGDEGYPGDPVYREFYRDAGLDAPYEYIKPFLNPLGERHHLGLKYHKITGEDRHKLPYDPKTAQEKAREHARHFVSQRNRQVEELSEHMDSLPVIVSPYDAELFGHWWFEGPIFLEKVLEEMGKPYGNIRTGTPQDQLLKPETMQISTPSASTWGYKGYYDIWINSDNDWVFKHLDMAAMKLESVLDTYCKQAGNIKQALLQCIRELMLAQSSDWPFLISTDSAPEYAKARIRTHLDNFWTLADQIENNAIDPEVLSKMKNRNNIFSELKCDIYDLGKHN